MNLTDLASEDPHYSFKQDPTEIVKGALLQTFGSGMRWCVSQVAPFTTGRGKPQHGFMMVLNVEWADTDGPKDAQIRIEVVREQ